MKKQYLFLTKTSNRLCTQNKVFGIIHDPVNVYITKEVPKENNITQTKYLALLKERSNPLNVICVLTDLEVFDFFGFFINRDINPFESIKIKVDKAVMLKLINYQNSFKCNKGVLKPEKLEKLLLTEFLDLPYGQKKPTKKELQKFIKSIFSHSDLSYYKEEAIEKCIIKSTMTFHDCTEESAYDKYWYNIIHEIGHFYLDFHQQDIFIDEECVRMWSLIVLKQNNWMHPLCIKNIEKQDDTERLQKQWNLVDTEYFRWNDSCKTSCFHLLNNFDLHPIVKLYSVKHKYITFFDNFVNENIINEILFGVR